MRKMRVVILFFASVLAATFFQNCGQGFKSGSSHSNGSLPASNEVPPGVVNNPGAPKISKGLKDTLIASDPNGVEVSIEVENAGGVNYRWYVGTQTFETTVPRFRVTDIGTQKISVVAYAPGGANSTSSAVYSISGFSVVSGKVMWRPANSGTYTEVVNADANTFRLLTVTMAADANRVFKFYSLNSTPNQVLVANAFSAHEINAHYFNVGARLFHHTQEVVGANGTAFVAFGDTASGKDGAKVFCAGAEVVGADPATYDLPYPKLASFAVDKSNIYMACKVKEPRPTGFQVVLANPTSFDGIYKTATGYFVVTTYTPNATSPVGIVQLPFTPASEAALKLFSLGGLGVLVSDATNLYHVDSGGASQVTGVDVATLQRLSASCYKDKFKVFRVVARTWTPVAGIDIATFVPLGYDLLYKDKNSVYVFRNGDSPTVVSGADLATIKALGSTGSAVFFADKNHLYSVMSSLAAPEIAVHNVPNPLDIKTVFGMDYIYDSMNLYYVTTVTGTSRKTIDAIPGVVPDNVRRFDGEPSYTLIAGTSVVRKGAVIPNIRGDKLTNFTSAMPNYFWSDGTNVYWILFDTWAKISTTANFHLVNPAVSGAYATNGLSAWFEDEPLVGADIPSLRVIDNPWRAVDNLGAWSGSSRF